MYINSIKRHGIQYNDVNHKTFSVGYLSTGVPQGTTYGSFNVLYLPSYMYV